MDVITDPNIDGDAEEMLTPVVVKAIQEQQSEIELMKEEIKKLKLMMQLVVEYPKK